MDLFDQLEKAAPRPDPTLKTVTEIPETPEITEDDLSLSKIEEYLMGRNPKLEFQCISPCDCPVSGYVAYLLATKYGRTDLKVTVNNSRLVIGEYEKARGFDLPWAVQQLIIRIDKKGYTNITAQEAISMVRAGRRNNGRQDL
jgi:hypothetical protein